MKLQTVAVVNYAYPFHLAAPTNDPDKVLVAVNKLKTKALYLYSLSNDHPPQFLLEQPILGLATHPSHNLVAIAGETTLMIYDYQRRQVVNKIVFPGTFVEGMGSLAWNHSGKLLTAAYEQVDKASYTDRITYIYSFTHSASVISKLYYSDSTPDVHCSWSPVDNFVAISGVKPGVVNIYNSKLKFEDVVPEASTFRYGPKPHHQAHWQQAQFTGQWYLEVKVNQHEDEPRSIATHEDRRLPRGLKLIWSPDATKLFFTSVEDGLIVTSIYDVKKDQVLPVPTDCLGIAASSHIFWTSDSKHLVYISFEAISLRLLSL